MKKTLASIIALGLTGCLANAPNQRTPQDTSIENKISHSAQTLNYQPSEPVHRLNPKTGKIEKIPRHQVDKPHNLQYLPDEPIYHLDEKTGEIKQIFRYQLTQPEQLNQQP